MKTNHHVTDHATDRGCDVSLIEQLKSIPLESSEWIKDEKTSGFQNIPYGRYCQAAAEVLKKAEAEVKLHKGLYAAALKEWQKDAQRLSELDAEHRQWFENREKSTFQNWIDRAEKAEAEFERLNRLLCDLLILTEKQYWNSNNYKQIKKAYHENTPRRNAYYAGKGCECSAQSSSECGCDVDWTDPRIYELEAEVERLRAILRTYRIPS